MRLILFAFPFIFLPFLLSGQSLKGTITDSITQQPLSYASVYWKKSQDGVLTNEDGEFSLAPPAFNKDSLVVSYIGYQTRTISQKQLKRSQDIALSTNDLKIEEIVVTPKDARDILRTAFRRRNRNHFVNKTMQPGFARSTIYYENEPLQVSEVAYNVFHFIDDSDTTSTNRTVKSRSVIDSMYYKEINNIINRKKDTVLIPPNFLSFGQDIVGTIEPGDEDGNSAEGTVEYNGTIDYQNRKAYDITFKVMEKEEPIFTGRFIIDKETYGFFALEINSQNEDQLHKQIPFAARAFLTLMGYHLRFTELSARIYYRYDDENQAFELDKGVTAFGMNVKKGGEWMHGRMSREFYLAGRIPSHIDDPGAIKEKYDIPVVDDFSANYFSGYYHLPTDSNVLELVEQFHKRNADYDGKIISDRHKRWLKRKGLLEE